MSIKMWRVVGLSLIGLTFAIGSLAAQTGDRIPGDPIPGASVKVGRKPPIKDKFVAQGTTDETGRCTFTDLGPGTYFLKLEVGGKSHKVEAGDAGDPITIAPPPAGGASTRMAVKPVVSTKKVGQMIVTIEVVGTSLAVNLNLSKSNVD